MINQSERQPTWRRTGTDVSGLSIPDALDAGGIGFKVGIAPLTAVYHDDDAGRDITANVNGYQVTYRQDTLTPIAPVGQRYHVVQTVEATGLIEEMTAAGWSPEFAGVIKKGRAVFMAGRLDFDTTTHEIDPYLCFVNSFDGSSGLKFACTPYRPACTNQVRAIFNRKSKARPVVSLRHTSNILKRTETVRELLGLSKAYYQYLDNQIEKLIGLTLNDGQIETALDVVAPLDEKLPEHVRVRREEKRNDVRHNLMYSPTIDSALRNTAWGLYNSITEIEQWGRDTMPTVCQSEQQLGNHLGIVPMTTTSDRVYRLMDRWLVNA